MKSSLLIFLLTFYLSLLFPSQLAFAGGNEDTIGLKIIWQKCFGGSRVDAAEWIENTSDSCFIIAGYAESYDGQVTAPRGDADFWIVKVNQYGNLLWQKSYGGIGRDYACTIKPTADKGFIVAGSTNSLNGDVHGAHGQSDFWVIKLDQLGNLQWQKCYGGSRQDICYALNLTSDGGNILAGCTYSNDGDLSGDHSSGDYWILKLKSDGAIEWQKTYGGTALDFSQAIVQCRDGGYLTAGYARSNNGDVLINHGQEDMWILKLDSHGNIKWQKSFGGTGGEGASSLQETMDGGFILAGVTHSYNLDVVGNHGDHDYWLVKIDSTGNMQWSQCLGGTYSDNGNFVKQTPDGGYLVAGESNSYDGMCSFNHGKYDYWIVKLNPTGSLEWQTPLGGSQDDECFSITESIDGSLLLAGTSYSNDLDVSGNHGMSDFWIVKCSLPAFHKYYRDQDGDSYGDPNNSVVATEIPTGFVTNSLDCNDLNSAVHPGALEDCNGIDDDCDFYIDEDFVTATIWPLTTTTLCSTSQLTLNCNTGEGFTYQWLNGGRMISGATDSTYIVTKAGSYSVRISHGSCSAVSPQTIIKMTSQNVVVIPPGIVSVCAKTPVTFSVTANPGLIFQWYGPQGLISGETGANFTTSVPGSYYVNISDITGCSFNSSTSSLQNFPLPSAAITVIGKLNICSTGSVTLKAQVKPDYTYQWYKNNALIANSTSDSYVATSAGNYKYLATTSNGCSAFSNSKTVTDCRQQEDSNYLGELKIFPNPCQNNFTVRFQSSDPFTLDGDLIIQNSVGQIVELFPIVISEGRLQFSVQLPDNVSSGIYLVRLQIGPRECSATLMISK